MKESFFFFFFFWGPPSDSWCNCKWQLPSYLFEQMSRKKLFSTKINISPTSFSHPVQKNGWYSIPSLPYSHYTTMWAKLGWEATLLVLLAWLSSWDTSFSPCELGKAPLVSVFGCTMPGWGCTPQASVQARILSCSSDCCRATRHLPSYLWGKSDFTLQSL